MGVVVAAAYAIEPDVVPTGRQASSTRLRARRNEAFTGLQGCEMVVRSGCYRGLDQKRFKRAVARLSSGRERVTFFFLPRVLSPSDIV
jgi:hypothetical protein